MSADLYFTGILLLLHSSSSFYRHAPAERAERNSTKIGHMLESNCNLKRMSKI